MSNPTFGTHVKWQVTAGNDWEESIKALEKLVRRISCMYNEKKKPPLQNRTVALLASAEHMFSQWSNVTCNWCVQVGRKNFGAELRMICTVI